MTGPKKNTERALIAALLLTALPVACSAEPDSDAAAETADGFRQWTLPDRLREISGLALTDDERLLAVADENAMVYEIDYTSGGLVKVFAFGRPVERGDFEGIAVLDGRVWLMTSDGDLYVGDEGGNGEQVAFERYETDIGKECELEGLVADPVDQVLLLVCKDGRKKKRLRVHRWSPVDGHLDDFKLPEKDMEDAVGRKKVRPSGIAIDPDSGDLLVVTAGQYAIFRIDRDGELIDVIMRLDPRRHRQAEGIAITGDGRLLIADEGGKGRARLAVYGAFDEE